MNHSKKIVIGAFALLIIATIVLFTNFFPDNKQLQIIKQAIKIGNSNQEILSAIDSVSTADNLNTALQHLIEQSDSLSKNEFESYLPTIQKIALLKLKTDSTINLLITKVEQSKYANQWKEILYPHFYTIAKKTQHVSDWNNCIRLCPSEDEKKEAIHERRKLFLDFEIFSKSNLNAEEILFANPCYTPLLTNMDRIHNKHYLLSDLYNNNYKADNYLRNRYIMADFNTINSLDECKGCIEEYAMNESLNEFSEIISLLKKEKIEYTSIEAIVSWYANLAPTVNSKWHNDFSRLKNYLQHVDKYRTAPMKKDPIIYIDGKPYCIGQRLCLCEIQNDTIIKVSQFVTSSKNAKAPQSNQHDYDGQPRYYAPQNKITSRFWDRELKYDSLDRKHDQEMGKGSSGVLKYRGAVDLPNFMHITPVDEFPGAKGFVNGIHEFAVGGKRPGLFMGTPISLGCVRLHDYPSKFTRWWTPYQANMFISYDSKHYIQKPLKGIKEIKSDKKDDVKKQKSSADKEILPSKTKK
jgi:hypothetical protein